MSGLLKQQTFLSELCMTEKIRDTITPLEKLSGLLTAVLAFPLIIMSILNVLKFYKKDRKRYY
jgi:hypothetical protein